jgi:hypothetical protein
MDEFEDYSEEISRRKAKLSREKLSCCVTEDRLVDEGLDKFYRELNVDSYLGYNWKKLAGKLLKPQPTTATIEHLSSSKNITCELLKTWVSQSNVLYKTFDSLIETMVECKLYSACDELLDFLEAEVNAAKKVILVYDRSNKTSIVPQTPEERATSHHSNQQYDLDAIEPAPVDLTIETSASQRHPKSRWTKKKKQTKNVLERSKSCPASWFKNFVERVRRTVFRRTISSPADFPDHPTPALPAEPTPPPPPQDEIFIVSSLSDSRTNGMRDLMSFVRRLKPVRNGELTVRTIHDVDQGGQVTATWLEERVLRARYVIVCFSKSMKEIVHRESQFGLQADYNLKFTIDFLVAGTIYESGCRNPDGKFIPVILDGHDRSAVIVSLRHFQNFCWPDEQERIMKYILNLPEYPVPRQGYRKPLVSREII